MRKFLFSDKGASAVEYTLIGALIAGVIIAVVRTLGLNVLALFQSFSTGW